MKTSKWTYAQVPAWIVWGTLLAGQCGVLYYGFQLDRAPVEVPPQATMLRNIGMAIAALCLFGAIVLRWLGPWRLIRQGLLGTDAKSGWRVLWIFVVAWILCSAASLISVVIYLVSHDRAMMIATWCAAFVSLALLVPRWSSIFAKVADPAGASASSPDATDSASDTSLPDPSKPAQ